jgi:choline kinase
MRAIILAAGIGARLYGNGETQPPKCQLRFDGQTLLQRHINALQTIGIQDLTLVVGYRKDEVIADAKSTGGDFVHIVENSRFREGPIVSLWKARDVSTSGERILFMDADVLYPIEMLEQLVKSSYENCFLFDENFKVGEDPVLLCLKDNEPVEFGKMIEGDFDRVGEWPGFATFSAEMSAKLVARLKFYLDQNLTDIPYEPAMRDLILSEPPGTFGFEDITGVPWVEIDFPEDLEKANKEIFPAINTPVARRA